MNTAAKDDNYDDAFSSLASLPDEPDRLKALADNQDPPADDPPADDPPADDPPADDPPVDDPPADDPPVDDGDDGDDGDAGDDGDDGDPAPKPAAKKGDPPAQTNDDALFERLSQMLNERGDKKAEEPPKAEPEPEPEIYTAEEQEILDAYRKDWPDIAKAEQLVRRAEYRNIVAYVFDQIGAELRPLMETVGAVAERTHLGELTERVPDYGDVRDKVVAWVDTQPGYLQEAYTRVIKEGTVEEVADLINRYREANPPAKAAAQPPKKEPELPSTTRKAAKSLAPVSSKRSVVPTGGDPDDFESAFEKFAEKM